MRHWLESDSTVVTPVLSLGRLPSPDNSGSAEGQKTWYDYAAKTNAAYPGTQVRPLLVARLLPDGTRSFTRADRNSLGQVLTNAATYTANGAVAIRTNWYAYDSTGIDLLTVTNVLGVQTSSNSYNAYHEVLTHFNPVNETTTYIYDTSQRLISITRPSGLVTTNIYGSDGFLATTYDYATISGTTYYYRTNSYTYANALVYTHTDERGMVTTNLYDNLQRLTNSSDARGTNLLVYTNLDLIRAVDRLGLANNFGYDPMRRRIASTNALGFYTLYNYCTCGALDSIQDAAGNLTHFFYDNQARVTNTVYVDSYSTTNFYNLISQVTNSIDSFGTSITNWFNNQGLLVSVSNALGQLSATTYDPLDRATNSTDANGVTLTNTFDDLNRLLTRGYPDGGVEHFAYTLNTAGPTSYTNQIGSNVINYFYDPLDRKIFEVFPGISTNGFAYDPAGDLTGLTDGKYHTTSWSYDRYGRTTNKLDAASTEILRYYYDADDRLTNRWSGARGTTTYKYDSVGNLTNIIYAVSHSVSMAYDSLNRLTNMVDASGTNKYTYTAAGQLLTEDGPFASDTVTNTYSNRMRIALALQQPTSVWTNGFIYDPAKRLTNLTSQAGTFVYAYTNAGSVISPSLLVQKLTLPNGAYVTNTFDPVARLLTTALKNSSDTTLDSYAYIYDPASQRTNLTRADGSTVAYRYDNAGQLKVATSSVSSENRGYLYDAGWNLNYLTNNGAVTAFTVDVDNQLTTEAGLNCSYDANGNLILVGDRFGISTVNYVYDDENRLVEVYTNYNVGSGPLTGGGAGLWDTLFAYDGFGRLRLRTEYLDGVFQGSTEYIYDGRRVIQERNESNKPWASYTRGIDLSGTLEGAGGIGGLLGRSSYSLSTGAFVRHDFYFADGNGNITSMTQSNQTLIASYRYDPFGNATSISGARASANIYRFSSKEQHLNSGMYYYGYRFYDPRTQRWINRDPVWESGGINLYAFVMNSPVGSADALGLACCKEQIEREKSRLLKRYSLANDTLQSRGIPHHGLSEGQYSCDSVNYPILNLLAKNTACWTCREEHRSRYISGLVPFAGNQWIDHWAVVCVSDDKKQSLLFDYWGDRPPGEDPRSWFDRRYPVPGFPGSPEWYHYPSASGPFPSTSPPSPQPLPITSCAKALAEANQ